MQNIPIPVASLGGGYSSDRQMPTQYTCLKSGQIVSGGGSKSIIEMSSSVEFSEITQQLSISTASTFNVGMFSSGFEFDYARYIQDASYSSSFYFYEVVQLPVENWQPPSFGPDVLTDFGLSVYKQDIEQFRNLCGDQFFQSSQQGGTLFATIKVNFNSESDTVAFNNAVNGQVIDIATATSVIQQAVTQINVNGAMEISAFQMGGDPSQLSSIFSSSQTGYYLSTCQLTNIPACDDVVSQLISYAAGNFANQMNVVNGKVEGNVSPVSYIFGDFSQDLGLKSSNSIITSEIDTARNQLAQVFNNLTSTQFILQQELNAGISNPGQIEAQLANVTFNLGVLMNPNQEQGAIGCYFYPEQCVQIAQNIVGQFEPVE